MDFKLILNKIDNTLSSDEKKIFDAWYRESREHRTYFNQVKENYTKGLDIVDIEKGWAGFSSKIKKKKNGYAYLKYVATVLILFAASSLWLLRTENSVDRSTQHAPALPKNQIEIGSDKATLTLEDGSEIILEKGESYETTEASSNGEQLIYNEKQGLSEKVITTNVLTIPRGGQFFVVLADGTNVWMNSDTQLKYPVAFAASTTRKVELVYGEAYFEVSPSTSHSGSLFVVQTEGQNIEVLGTQFNIKAYQDDDHIATTLVEGKVLVNSGTYSEGLAPGQQSIINRKTKKLEVSSVDVYNEISWKDGLFSFKDRSLEDIMKVLSRWYDVDVVFKNEALKELTFNGVLRKNLQLREILNIVQNTNEVNYEINEKTITME